MSRAVLLVAIVSVACSGAALASPARPSKSACAVAWNASASTSLRRTIVGRHPQGAFVAGSTSVFTDTWTRGGSSASTRAAGCGIQFILPVGRTLAVFGAWKNGRVGTWSGPVVSTRAIPVRDNANVGADATVGFHG